MDRYLIVGMAEELTPSGIAHSLIVDTQGTPAVVAVVKTALATTIANALNGA